MNTLLARCTLGSLAAGSLFISGCSSSKAIGTGHVLSAQAGPVVKDAPQGSRGGRIVGHAVLGGLLGGGIAALASAAFIERNKNNIFAFDDEMDSIIMVPAGAILGMLIGGAMGASKSSSSDGTYYRAPGSTNQLYNYQLNIKQPSGSEKRVRVQQYGFIPKGTAVTLYQDGSKQHIQAQ
jgi:hypothetical protein